jgi:hypothetical protein
VTAAEARPVAEAEFVNLVGGCWSSDHATAQESAAGIVSDLHVCFRPNGRLESMWIGGDNRWGLEGLGSDGAYEVRNQKLILTGEGDGWLFQRTNAECDAYILPGARLELRNCIGSGPKWNGDETPEALGDRIFVAEGDE